MPKVIDFRGSEAQQRETAMVEKKAINDDLTASVDPGRKAAHRSYRRIDGGEDTMVQKEAVSRRTIK